MRSNPADEDLRDHGAEVLPKGSASRALLALLFCAFAVHDGTADDSAHTAAHWFRLEYNDEEAGHLHWRPTDDGYESESIFRFDRDGQDAALVQFERYGRSALPRLDWISVLAAGDTLHRTALFGPDSIRVLDANGSLRLALERPADLLLPDGRDSFFARQLSGGTTSLTQPLVLSFQRFLPELERVVPLTARTEPGPGNDEDIVLWELVVADAPHLRTLEWRNRHDGRLIRWESPSSGWSAVRTSERPELPSRPTARLSSGVEDVGFQFRAGALYESILYHVHSPEGGAVLPEHPTLRREVASTERTTKMDATTGPGDHEVGPVELRVLVETVRLKESPAPDGRRTSANPDPTRVPLGRETGLEASEWADYDHPAIRSLHSRLDCPKSPPSQARCLAGVAHSRLQPSADSHFARASTALLQGRGDCTEYAVLFAALARASGLPTRFVAGWVGIDRKMGYHLWNEVYLEGRWVGVDAALDRFPTDARYVPMILSSLGEDDPAQLFRELAAAASVRLEVIEVRER